MRLHLVDGTYELVRAHFAPGPSRRDDSGRNVKASVGLIASLVKLLHDPPEAVTHIAVAFDDPIESFRNRLFDGYKTSASLPEDVLQQFPLAQAGIRALGLALWPQDEFEADDAIATAVTRADEAFCEIRILSPDKDFGQLVNNRVVQVDRARNRVIDEAGVVDRLGVAPAGVPLLLALQGDVADGIPGVPGFGAKSAQTVVNRYGTLEAIPTACAQWDVSLRGRDKLCETLNAMRSEVALYVTLARLRTDVPLACGISDVRFDGIPQAAFVAWCDTVNATTLKTRPRRWKHA